MLRPLILASTSPRRQSLLAELGIPFTISAPTLEQETLDPALPLAEALEHLALEKARSVARDNPQALVLGADTRSSPPSPSPAQKAKKASPATPKAASTSAP